MRPPHPPPAALSAAANASDYDIYDFISQVKKISSTPHPPIPHPTLPTPPTAVGYDVTYSSGGGGGVNSSGLEAREGLVFHESVIVWLVIPALIAGFISAAVILDGLARSEMRSRRSASYTYLAFYSVFQIVFLALFTATDFVGSLGVLFHVGTWESEIMISWQHFGSISVIIVLLVEEWILVALTAARVKQLFGSKQQMSVTAAVISSAVASLTCFLIASPKFAEPWQGSNSVFRESGRMQTDLPYDDASNFFKVQRWICDVVCLVAVPNTLLIILSVVMATKKLLRLSSRPFRTHRQISEDSSANASQAREDSQTKLFILIVCLHCCVSVPYSTVVALDRITHHTPALQTARDIATPLILIKPLFLLTLLAVLCPRFRRSLRCRKESPATATDMYGRCYSAGTRHAPTPSATVQTHLDALL